MQAHAQGYDSTGGPVSELNSDLPNGARAALFAVLGGVGLVLSIVCLNVTNLLLARDAQSQSEFMLRTTALGASRTRILRQMLTESCIRTGLGGAVLPIASMTDRIPLSVSLKRP